MAFERLLGPLWVVCIVGCSTSPGTAGERASEGGPGSLEGFAPADLGAVFIEALNPDPDHCLPRTIGGEGTRVGCTVLEVNPGSTLACDPSRGRGTPGARLRTAAEQRLRQEGMCGAAGLPNCSSFRICELRQASDACRHAGPISEVGWCYVDPSEHPTDDPALVAACAPNERRRIRYVDPKMQTPEPGSSLLIGCWGTP